MKLYYDKDADLAFLANKNILFIGYGSQGRSHALNLRDSGIENIKIALYAASKSAQIAQQDGFLVTDIISGLKDANFIVMALPDEKQAKIYDEYILPYAKSNVTLCFIHGYNIYFEFIKPKADMDVIMVAPKGPGPALRSEYLANRGLLALFAVQQNVSNCAKEQALAYAKALGCGRAAIIETCFKDETVGDLFGEQAVLCGGLVSLISTAFEVLTQAGIAKEIAYLECVHEVKLIADMIYKKGIAQMNEAISNTAEWGEYCSGKRVIDDKVRQNMKLILQDIISGDFAKLWSEESNLGSPNLHRIRKESADSAIEKTGKAIRALLPWLENSQ